MIFSDFTNSLDIYERDWLVGRAEESDIRWFDESTKDEQLKYIEQMHNAFLQHVLRVVDSSFTRNGPPFDFRMSEYETLMAINYINGAKTGNGHPCYLKAVVKANADKHRLQFTLSPECEEYYNGRFRKMLPLKKRLFGWRS
jgi:hypothetical protein